MARTKKKGRRVRPVIFVFCEGQTEEQFVHYLRNKYRCPIEIRTKVSTTKILQKGYVKRNTSGRIPSMDDKVFLLYDLDIDGVFEKLSSIKKTDLLASNPCFELWLLFHATEHRSALSAGECNARLKRFFPNYQKGQKRFFEEHRKDLENGYFMAKGRAEATSVPNNPSTDVYRLVDHIRRLSNNKER